MILYIVSYCIIGYVAALIYYKKAKVIDGKPIEHRGRKAFALFLLWPMLIVSAVILLPFFKEMAKEKKGG